MTHELKINRKYYNEIVFKVKTFEIRYNDRDYQSGDRVVLRCYADREYDATCPAINATIGFVTDYEQKKEWVVFSLLFVERER